MAVGESPGLAAWAYRGLAAAAMIALVLLAARLSARPAFAAAFVGWNPLLAVHFAGGGHNDAWMMAFVLAALALAATGRPGLAGASWAVAITIKWVPLLFLPLRFLAARRAGRQVDHRGLALGLAVIVAIATWRYGLVMARRRWPAGDEPRRGSRLVRNPERDRLARPARGGSRLRLRRGLRRSRTSGCFARRGEDEHGWR